MTTRDETRRGTADLRPESGRADAARESSREGAHGCTQPLTLRRIEVRDITPLETECERPNLFDVLRSDHRSMLAGVLGTDRRNQLFARGTTSRASVAKCWLEGRRGKESCPCPRPPVSLIEATGLGHLCRRNQERKVVTWRSHRSRRVLHSAEAAGVFAKSSTTSPVSLRIRLRSASV